MAIGALFTIGLAADGGVWTWGSDLVGQLGYALACPTPLSLYTCYNAVPTQLRGLTAVTVTAGTADGFAIATDGTVWGWGSNYGDQLGNGQSCPVNSSFYACYATAPTQVVSSGTTTPLTGVVSVAAGAVHTLALRSDGTVWAWGGNAYGQLGSGTTISTTGALPVAGLSNIVAVAASGYHSLALRRDGTVWGWGWNAYGQIGSAGGSLCGTNPCSPIPVLVNGLPFEGASAIAAGVASSYAVTPKGYMWSWGANRFGQLGNPYVTSSDGFCQSAPCSAAPVPVYSTNRQCCLSNVARAVAGDIHVLAILRDGSLVAWGDNSYGQLGVGSFTASNLPVTVPNVSNVSAIAAGNRNSAVFGTLASPTAVPTATGTVAANATATSSPTVTATNTPLAIVYDTPPATATTESTATATAAVASDPTSTATTGVATTITTRTSTATVQPNATDTSTVTATGTSTATTPPNPTDTPTGTATATAMATGTAGAQSSATGVPASATEGPTVTATASTLEGPTPPPTATVTASPTPVPTEIGTSTDVATAPASSTAFPAVTMTASPSPLATSTTIVVATSTSSSTPSATVTATPSASPTATTPLTALATSIATATTLPTVTLTSSSTSVVTVEPSATTTAVVLELLPPGPDATLGRGAVTPSDVGKARLQTCRATGPQSTLTFTAGRAIAGQRLNIRVHVAVATRTTVLVTLEWVRKTIVTHVAPIRGHSSKHARQQVVRRVVMASVTMSGRTDKKGVFTARLSLPSTLSSPTTATLSVSTRLSGACSALTRSTKINMTVAKAAPKHRTTKQQHKRVARHKR